MVAMKSQECFRYVVSGSCAWRVETAYKLTRGYLCFPKGELTNASLL
jgi:hypothetical protein